MLKPLWLQFKRRCIPYIIAYGSKITIRLLLFTCRKEFIGLDRFIATAQKNPCILMLWHNRLSIMSGVLNSATPKFIYTAVISKSRDGDPLAILVQSYKNGRVLRVAHNARHQALSRMITTLKERQGIVLITPDGPRGPRYSVKPGIVMAARESGAHIIPLSWSASHAWQLSTWDQMLIPKPFSKIKISFGTPIFIQKESTANFESETERLRSALENRW